VLEAKHVVVTAFRPIGIRRVRIRKWAFGHPERAHRHERRAYIGKSVDLVCVESHSGRRIVAAIREQLAAVVALDRRQRKAPAFASFARASERVGQAGENRREHAARRGNVKRHRRANVACCGVGAGGW
jgi:hypothetical protein